MDFYPAIDLRDGKCVRLYQGDYGQETIYGDDPVAQARAFEAAGAPWIHVVDLDAARTGEPVNRAVIADIAAGVAVACKTVIDLDRDANAARQDLAPLAQLAPYASQIGAIITNVCQKIPELCK